MQTNLKLSMYKLRMYKVANDQYSQARAVLSGSIFFVMHTTRHLRCRVFPDKFLAKFRISFWTKCCILLALSGSAGWGQAATRDTLRADLAAVRAQHHIPVLAVSIARDGATIENIVLGGSSSTPLRWGSITKTFTALTILKLHEAGLLDLYAPLTTYLDDILWQNRWRTTDPIRVIHLLELRAGFTDLSGEEFNFNEPVSLSQALQLNPKHRSTRWPPGLQHGYSNMTLGLSSTLR